MTLAMLLERLGPGKIVDRMMPTPGSNRHYRHYRHGTVFETFMLMFHEGAQCLEECVIYAMVGQVVHHGRQRILKVPR